MRGVSLWLVFLCVRWSPVCGVPLCVVFCFGDGPRVPGPTEEDIYVRLWQLRAWSAHDPILVLPACSHLVCFTLVLPTRSRLTYLLSFYPLVLVLKKYLLALVLPVLALA
jgi:hypothetical protein